MRVLSERLKDDRSKRVIFVSHCILNENARYLGGAFRRGCVEEIVDELKAKGYGIVQIKCPEQKAWGGPLKPYLWMGVAVENSVLYKLRKLAVAIFLRHTRRVYRKLAKEVVKEIASYEKHGFEVVGVIGIGGSPTCGVNITLDLRKFDLCMDLKLNEIERNSFNDLLYKELLKEGKGLFVEALENELQNKNMKVKFFEHSLLSERKGDKISSIVD